MWDFLVKLFSNAWVVGIGGGIISGIIVYFITAGILHRKENTKYLEQINNANLDIIRSLKPYIAEKGLPEKEIIDAIILSTARKYKVKSEELYSIRIVCEELIREIVENVYVSADKKQEYTAHLREYLHNLNKERDKSLLVTEIEKELIVSTKINKMEYSKKLSSTFSIMVAMLSAFLTLFSFVMLDVFPIMSGSLHGMETVIIITVITMAMIVMCLFVVTFQRLLERAKKSHNDDKTENKKDNK